MKKVFLEAEWRYLVLINYAIDPSVLRRRVPPGTELDFEHSRTYVSLVGFQFLNTRVLGIGLPFHRDFEEVNLRFYVRRRAEDGWRRGVVFIRELVPRRMIAFVARTFYGEPYSALPMRHSVEQSDSNLRASYAWRRGGKWESILAKGSGPSVEIEPDSHEEFIAEHYWGYNAHRGGCVEYQVEHARWRIWHASESHCDVDVASLYGEDFVESLSKPPHSAFIAEGSPVFVRGKSKRL